MLDLFIVLVGRNCQPANYVVNPTKIVSYHGLVTWRFLSKSLAVKRNTVTARPWKKLDMQH